MISRTYGRASTGPNPFSATATRPGHSITEQFEEAIVVDVIVNNEHLLYATDGYNVGAIQFRFVNTNFFRSDDILHWAFPIDANRSEYPLLHEIVYIVRGLNRFYYIKSLNIVNRVTSQPLFGLNIEAQPVVTGTDATKALRASTASPIKASKQAETKLGDYFTETAAVYRLKHVEGDAIYEGRSGQSMRFGTSWLDGDTGNVLKKPFKAGTKDQSPNILIRIGPDPQANRTVKSPFGQVVEDINKDATSLWMAQDQLIPLITATHGNGVEGISVPDFPNQFDGNQFVINTDRFIVNTKTGKILGHAANGIHWTTLKDFTVDSDQNHVTWTSANRNDRVVQSWKKTIGQNLDTSAGQNIQVVAGRNHILEAQNNINTIASKIHVGSFASEDEPLVLGETLREFLTKLIDLITKNPLILLTGRPLGPSMLNPEILTGLKDLQETYLSGGTSAKILSLDNFTIRDNDTPDKARQISKYKDGA